MVLWRSFLWIKEAFLRPRRHHAAKANFGHGDFSMIDVALFILACTFLFGLAGYLFRDQITSRLG
jgi:hypothetical protein